MLHDIDAERREVVGGLAARMLERQGFAGGSSVTGDLDRALDGADVVLIQIRVGGQAARLRTRRSRCRAAASARRRPGPAASRRRCGRSRWCWRSPSGPRAGRPGRVDRRLHQPGRDRHASPARRGPSCGRAVQRRDRLPARDRAGCSASAGPGRRRPGGPQPPDLGPRRPARRARRARRRCWTSTARRSPSSVELPPELLAELGAMPSYYLRYFYDARRGARRAARRATPRAEQVAEIERELLDAVPRPGR